ncbi:hypothetical protein [Alsobacter sp. R-9]
MMTISSSAFEERRRGVNAQSIAQEVLDRYRALPGLADIHIKYLLERGVPAQALHRPEVLVRADVHHLAGARFVFADELRAEAPTTAALIVVAHDQDGVPDDLIAWSPRAGVLGTWLGRRCCVGDAYGPRLDEHGGLLVHADPLGWLQADRRGVAVVDPALAREHLWGAGPFVVDGDVTFARHLETVLTLPSPDIIVIRPRQEAA